MSFDADRFLARHVELRRELLSAAATRDPQAPESVLCDAVMLLMDLQHELAVLFGSALIEHERRIVALERKPSLAQSVLRAKQ
jgi:hypothetical protein